MSLSVRCEVASLCVAQVLYLRHLTTSTPYVRTHAPTYLLFYLGWANTNGNNLTIAPSFCRLRLTGLFFLA